MPGWPGVACPRGVGPFTSQEGAKRPSPTSGVSPEPHEGEEPRVL